jgi:hypothetical protein
MSFKLPNLLPDGAIPSPGLVHDQREGRYGILKGTKSEGEIEHAEDEDHEKNGGDRHGFSRGGSIVQPHSSHSGTSAPMSER